LQNDIAIVLNIVKSDVIKNLSFSSFTPVYVRLFVASNCTIGWAFDNFSDSRSGSYFKKVID